MTISQLQGGESGPVGWRNRGAFQVISGVTRQPFVVLCDHASNALPPEYADLGLSAHEFSRHIAYDIGALGVVERLVGLLGAPGVATCFSRLLIDCNRGVDDPTLIMRISDGAVIPGNRNITPEERARRIERFYNPYHGAVAGVMADVEAQGMLPILVSIHSFTPVWRGVLRPWHTAVLWDKDPRLAVPLLAGLRAVGDLVVGDNEPYLGALLGDTLWQHGTSRGLAHALVEIRQDLIADASGQQAWAERLAVLLQSILAQSEVRQLCAERKYYGSHAS